MLMMDCIIKMLEIEGEFGKGLILVEFDIMFDLWFFDCYFLGDLVMLGCLGLDVMW